MAKYYPKKKVINKKYYKRLFREWVIYQAQLIGKSPLSATIGLEKGLYDDMMESLDEKDYKMLDDFARKCLDPFYLKMIKAEFEDEEK